MVNSQSKFAVGKAGKFLLDEGVEMQNVQLKAEVERLRSRLREMEAAAGNTHICSRYVKEWGLKEALREFIQNFFDACIRRCEELGFDTDLMRVKHQLCFTLDGTPYRNYWVYTRKPEPTVFGVIRYDPELQRLTFQNAGFIAKGCLLLGGGNKDGSSKCAGKFGEGMKLSLIHI